MVIVKCKSLVALFFTLTILTSESYSQKTVEEGVLPSILKIENALSQQELSSSLKIPQVAVVIRIPASTIAKSLNRDFHNAEPVQREILGTRSQGQAVCHGFVTGTLEDNPQGAAFCCRIEGTVDSDTCGTNGPAIIHSKAKTNYVALKRIVFTGTHFVATPTTVNLNTQLQITGIDSDLPALRGRIVKRVATKRAQESHAQAQAIATAITRDELSSRMDREFDTRLNDLNRKLTARLSLVEHFRAAGNEIFVRSFKDSVEIGFLTPPLTRADVDTHRFPVGESVELWIGNGGGKPLTDIPLTQVPGIARVIDQAPHWLATYLSRNPQLSQLSQLSKLDEKNLKIKRHEEWIVFQLLD